MANLMIEAINKQISREYYSSYLYLSMSAWFEDQGLPGFAHWMRIQAEEEMIHFNKFFDYMVTKSQRIVLGPIEAPPHQWKDITDVFSNSLAHEKMISTWIGELVSLAIEQKDFATQNFLQWFVAEQVEEEANATKILSQLRLIGENGQGIYLLDKELATRVISTAANASVA